MDGEAVVLGEWGVRPVWERLQVKLSFNKFLYNEVGEEYPAPRGQTHIRAG